ncbi:MAG TPA: DUF72 domain-containing protein [Rubricoccaceae bacterium]|nr:DUF72 domain-containing protein [Rubricoccaceae bacterium]
MADAPPPVADRRTSADRYDFRRLHPLLRFGTASDRYAGWLGKVYPPDVWADQVTSRKKRLGTGSFEERLLPVESVEDYFQHFSVLELDFTFYRALLEANGKSSTNLFTLQRYAELSPQNARFLLKAPQAFTARLVRQRGDDGPRYEENPAYLDAQAFTDRFLAPALDTLGPKLAGVLFEQEYARVREAPPLEAFLVELDQFFRDVPDEVPVHLEIRSPHLLLPPYFEWLESRGLGFAFSYWRWLPPLRDQWRLAGERFSSAFNEAVVRLLSPSTMTYDDALLLAGTFDAPHPALAETPEARAMVNDATALAYQAVAHGVTLNVIASNRAWGCAPDLAQTVAHRFLDFAERKGA